MKRVSDGELLLNTLPEFLIADIAIVYVDDDLSDTQKAVVSNIFNQIATTSKQSADQFSEGSEAAVSMYQLSWLQRAMSHAGIALNQTVYSR